MLFTIYDVSLCLPIICIARNDSHSYISAGMRIFHTTAAKDDKNFNLYAPVNDRSVELDLQCSASSSFIKFQESNSFSDAKDNFTNLAVGAISHHAHMRGLKITGPVTEIESMPKDLKAHHMGGHSGSFAVAVYQEEI